MKAACPWLPGGTASSSSRSSRSFLLFCFVSAVDALVAVRSPATRAIHLWIGPGRRQHRPSTASLGKRRGGFRGGKEGRSIAAVALTFSRERSTGYSGASCNPDGTAAELAEPAEPSRPEPKVTEEKEEKVLLRSSGESLLYSGGKDSPQLTPLPDPRSASAALANETTNGIPFSSILLLNLVAILWGTQHAVIKSVLTGWDGGSGFAAGSSIAGPHVDPAVFTFARFTVAAAAATLGNIFASSRSAPSAGSTVTTAQKAGSEGNRGGRGENKDGVKPASLASALRWGAEMGSWMFLGFAFQAVGLQYTTASKSGFLLYLNVKLVPLLAFVFLGRPLTVTTAASALTAFAGTFLLATSGCAAVAGDGSDVGGWNVGDAWSVAAALASAMFILRLERASAEVPNASSLNACCLWTVALFSGLWTAVPSMIAIQSIQDPGGTTGCLAPILPLLHDAANLIESRGWEIAYLSVVTTALANWIQAKGQRDVPAERASVLYAMDPVYGAIFAHLWLGENLEGPSAWVGAALITVAAVTSALLDVPPEKCRPREEPSPSSSSRRREL